MTTTTKSGAGVSRYLRLYRVLSQALAEGFFAAGQALPSEPRLMRDYGVSRSTVRRALARLEAEGRIDRKRGSGTFARDRRGRPAAAPRDLSSVLNGATGSPAAATRRTIAFQPIPTPAFLQGERPGFGATALLVRQIRYIEREPIVLETAYLPQEIGSGLIGPKLDTDVGGGGSTGVDGSAILTVLAALGHRSSSLEREFAALEADPLAATSLGIAVGAPVFNVRTLARDLQHRIVAYVSCLYRPDRYEAHATLEIGRPKPHRTGKRS
jgi:GntR family transcriptional regulator